MMPRNGKSRRRYARIICCRRARGSMIRLHGCAAEPPLKHIAVLADVVQHACICPLRRRTKACRKIRGKRRDILKMLDEQLTIRVHVGRAVREISQMIAPPFSFGNFSIQ